MLDDRDVAVLSPALMAFSFARGAPLRVALSLVGRAKDALGFPTCGRTPTTRPCTFQTL